MAVPVILLGPRYRESTSCPTISGRPPSRHGTPLLPARLAPRTAVTQASRPRPRCTGQDKQESWVLIAIRQRICARSGLSLGQGQRDSRETTPHVRPSLGRFPLFSFVRANDGHSSVRTDPPPRGARNFQIVSLFVGLFELLPELFCKAFTAKSNVVRPRLSARPRLSYQPGR